MCELVCSKGDTVTITQKDIAERLGLSRSFVTRVLANPESVRVSDETRDLIARTALEMGYRPNFAAKSVREKRFYQIGVLAALPFIHPLGWHYVEGINKGLIDRGFAMSLIRLTDVEQDGGLASRAFQGHMLDGLIGVVNVPTALQPRIESLVPNCVWLNTDIWADDRCLQRDEGRAVETALRNLVALGYRRIAYLRVAIGDHFSHHERHGAVTALAGKMGLAVSDIELPVAERDRAIADLIATTDPFTVILAVDGYLAQVIEHIAVAIGCRPGRDFALAALDDTPGAWDALSRVNFPRVEMGEAAAEMALGLTGGEAGPSRRFDGEWVAGTTAPQVLGC